MGMDVYGKHADSVCEHGSRKHLHNSHTEPDVKQWCEGPRGSYFRNNWWWWRPLWDYCHTVAPDLIDDDLWAVCHANSGRGLSAADSRALAARLRDEIRRGATAAVAAERQAMHAAIPDEPCESCAGTGRRTDHVAERYPHLKQKCNGCGGTGQRRPTETWYSFDVDNVEKFADFLEHCGGFACH